MVDFHFFGISQSVAVCIRRCRVGFPGSGLVVIGQTFAVCVSVSRISVVFHYFRIIVQSVFVRVESVRIGSVVDFKTVVQLVGFGVGRSGIRLVRMYFIRITKPVIISIGPQRIRPVLYDFHIIIQTILVCIAITWIRFMRPDLFEIPEPVTVRIVVIRIRVNPLLFPVQKHIIINIVILEKMDFHTEAERIVHVVMRIKLLSIRECSKCGVIFLFNFLQRESIYPVRRQEVRRELGVDRNIPKDVIIRPQAQATVK